MTPAQIRLRELRARQSTERGTMAELSLLDELSTEQRSQLDGIEKNTGDLERLLRAATVAADAEDAASVVATGDGEGAELRELRSRVQLSGYVAAALEQRNSTGAEAEYNAAVKVPPNQFPLELLAPRELRATTDTDAAAMQRPWLDRLFSESCAMKLGVSFQSVAPGVATYPVTSTGPTPSQRGRSEAAADGAWTVTSTEIKPTRNAVRCVFSEEDAYRLPGLEDALRRDLSPWRWSKKSTEASSSAMPARTRPPGTLPA